MMWKKLLIRYVSLLAIMFVMAVLSALLKATFGLGNSFMMIVVANALAGAVLMSSTFTSTVLIPYQDSQGGLVRIAQIVQRWGWRQRTKTEQMAIYQPPALVAALMNNLCVSFLSPSTLRITGPEPIVFLLRAQLSKI